MSGSLWAFNYLGVDYSFALSSVTVEKPVFGSTLFLILSGQGIASITGFDPTPGFFSLTTQGPINPAQPGATDVFSFSAQTNVPAAVPEPATLLLVGTGLTGLALRRRRRG